VKKWIATLLLVVVVSTAQERPSRQPPGFRWNWREAQELKADEQALATLKISASERAKLLKALVAQFKGSSEPAKRAARTRVKLIDLNADGVPEAVSQATDDEMCSPTGNCSFWIFQRGRAGYRLLLEKHAIQTFTIQRTQTNGFYDLVLGMHGSATQEELFVYQFRRGRYHRAACYDANWTYLGKDGEYHHLREPRVTPCQTSRLAQ
jgi:hypothetical protein